MILGRISVFDGLVDIHVVPLLTKAKFRLYTFANQCWGEAIT